jgi:ABC-type dipeptide/oligopeptide/nickel transport system permease component
MRMATSLCTATRKLALNLREETYGRPRGDRSTAGSGSMSDPEAGRQLGNVGADRWGRIPAVRLFRWMAGTGPWPIQKGWWSRRSAFWVFAVRRASLIPVQLVFILFILYAVLNLPAAYEYGAPGGALGYPAEFLRGFYVFLVNNFDGSWGNLTIWPGVGTENLGQGPLVTWALYFEFYIPSSIQLAAFALPIAAAIAYPVSLLAGWSRRPELDAPARALTLLGALLPVFVVGILVLNVLFFPYEAVFQDIPSLGLLPSIGWFVLHGGYPSWIYYQAVTRPTGFPLIDALLHHAWTMAEIILVKTLIQASVIAVAYVAIFFRHARAVVRSIRDEPHIVGARARGVSERTLLWRQAARRATPTFLLIFALTIPEFFGVLLAVEIAFIDQSGFGYLYFYNLGDLPMMEAIIFLVAVVVLVSTFLVDVIAVRLDPRSLQAR